MSVLGMRLEKESAGRRSAGVSAGDDDETLSLPPTVVLVSSGNIPDVNLVTMQVLPTFLSPINTTFTCFAAAPEDMMSGAQIMLEKTYDDVVREGIYYAILPAYPAPLVLTTA